MVELTNIPPIDPRTREALFGEMRKSLRDRGITVKEDDGEILSALVVLYSHMLSGTVKRLNRTPEKHRAAFLNLAHTPPRPAWPGSGVVAFDVVSGYDNPVEIKRGTRVAADRDGTPISFRLRADVTAIPAAVTDVYWCDASRGCYGCAQTLSGLRPWHGDNTREAAYKADFIFKNIFYNNSEAALFIEVSLQSHGLPASVLVDVARWSYSPWPQDEPIFLNLHVSEHPDGGLFVRTQGPIPDSEYIRIRMELTDPGFAGLRVGGMHMTQLSGSALPGAVLTSERGLEIGGFYPFGSPFNAYEECGLFCDAALSQNSAEITARFALTLEISEEWLPEIEEVIDYKWIMRKPLPKPKPIVYEAFAKSVRLEYWNGETYREIHDQSGHALNFTQENPRVELSFTCPEDIAPCEYYGRTGYYLRLSCAGCDELYKLPRRVYTPHISGLSFSYDHVVKHLPVRAESESLGRRMKIEPARESPTALFESPPWRDALLLGFDRLTWECRLKMYAALEGARTRDDDGEHQSLKALLCGEDDCGVLPVRDFTDSLNSSGGIWLDIPENAQPSVLFGKERYWVALLTDSQMAPVISGIYLNTGIAENRIRYEESFSFTHLKNRRLTLAHADIVRAWVYVRSLTDGEMELWREYEASIGKFREGFYKISYSDGLLTFPPDIVGRGMGEDILDLIRVVYDATDGKAANLPADSITRMEEDIPFIQSVRNPLAIVSGADGETGGELAVRKRHALYNGGRVTTKRDFELFAIDNCPLVSDAKCTYDAGNKTVVLAVRMTEAGQQTAFAKIERDLKRHFSALIREGINLDLVLWEALP